MLDNLGDLKRTHYCGDLGITHVGQTVTVMGWVHRRRDFGPLIFIDLRDREGLVQIVLDAEKNPKAHGRAGELRSEFVIAVAGKVVARNKETVNRNLKTGEIEVVASELYILNTARTPPF